MPQYKSNYLRNVIVRADFINECSELASKMPDEIGKTALSVFPISEPKEVIEQLIEFKDEKIKQDRIKQINWHYFSKDRKDHLCLNSKFFFIETKNYQSFDAFKSQFSEILGSLYKCKNDLQISRLGLRYIDEIKLDEENPFDWQRYLDEKLLSGLNIPHDQTEICRFFSVLEINKNEYRILFQYGIDNPDYPSRILKKSFVLDTDVFCHGVFNKDLTTERLDLFHQEALDLFELSIKEELRAKMNE